MTQLKYTKQYILVNTMININMHIHVPFSKLATFSFSFKIQVISSMIFLTKQRIFNYIPRKRFH